MRWTGHSLCLGKNEIITIRLGRDCYCQQRGAIKDALAFTISDYISRTHRLVCILVRRWPHHRSNSEANFVMPTLYITVGLPGAGKTSFLKEMKEPSIVHVSPDLLRSEEDNPAERLKMASQQLSDALVEGHNIYYDSANITARSRAEVIEHAGLAPDEYLVVALVFQVDLFSLYERNNNRPPEDQVPISVLSEMFERFEYPVISEGLDKVVDVV